MCILYPKVKGQLFIGIIIFYKNTSCAILKHHNLEIRVETVFNSTIIPQALRCGLEAGASFGATATIYKNCSPQNALVLLTLGVFLHFKYKQNQVRLVFANANILLIFASSLISMRRQNIMFKMTDCSD